jgi:hypothetical protein
VYDGNSEERIAIGVRTACGFHRSGGSFSVIRIKKLHGTGFRPSKFIQKIAIVRHHGVSFEPYWQ